LPPDGDEIAIARCAGADSGAISGAAAFGPLFADKAAMIPDSTLAADKREVVITRAIWCALAALAGFIVGLAVVPARADFYSLEGRFQCLDNPAAQCADMSRLTPPKSFEDDSVAKALPAPQPSSKPLPAAAPAPPGDPLLAIAARIKAGHRAPDDIAQLQALAKRGDARAVELLAWCDYAGIGVARDPVAAYLLYGVAASAGVPRASQNQAVIFEYVLDQNQRQLVLDIQNEDIKTTVLR